MSNDTRFNEAYSVFVGQRSSLSHGPAYIGNDIFVGMKSLTFNAKIENNIAIGMSSTITWE